MSQLTAPAPQKDRIEIIDAIRGLALLGILMMNIPFFSNPVPYHFNIFVNNETSGANYYTWWVVNMGFEGTMRALFTMLFGAGSILLLRRLEQKQTTPSPADIYYRRLLWLLLFGFINAFIFLWPGDILYSYAICGLFLFPFRHMKAKHLAVIGLCLLLVTTAKDSYKWYGYQQVRKEGEKVLALEAQKKQLTLAQEEAKGAWMGLKEKSSLESQRKEANDMKEKMQQNYACVFSYYRTVNVWIQTDKFYSSYFLDIVTLLFLGMALFKWNIFSGSRNKKFYWLLLLTGYGAGLSVSYYWISGHLQSRFDPTRYFDLRYVDLYQTKRLLLALGHMSVLMLLYKYGVARWLLHLLRNVGQMAFTNYLMQSIICTTIFYGYGFGLYGKLQRYEEYYVVGAVWLFQIIFSAVWLQYYRFGPFEWEWRSLTYWKRQPMRKQGDANANKPEEGQPVQEAVMA